MADATRGSPRRLRTTPMDWHPLPLTPRTKKALMESFSHYENFSYDEATGGFLVEVPVPPGHGKVPRATPAILKDHVEVDIKLTHNRKRAISQPRRPLEECYSWWLGQLVHYGLQLELSTDEAKQVMKSAILQGALRVPAHLKKMEQRMRSAAYRRTRKREARRSTKRPTSKKHHMNIKDESTMSGSENEGDTVHIPASRRCLKPQAKLEKDSSSESDSNSIKNDSSASDSDIDTIEELPTLNSAANKSKTTTKKKPAIVKGPIKLAPLPACARNVNTRHKTNNLSSDSDRDEDEDEPTVTKEESLSSGEDISDIGSFSGDSEYERAVISHSQAIDGASAKYGDTDTDSASDSSSDDEIKFQSLRQPPSTKVQDKLRDKQDVLRTLSVKSASGSQNNQPAKAKHLEINRDRKPRPEELEGACTPDTTPSRKPKNLFKRDESRSGSPISSIKGPATANVHLAMTYDDISDPAMRRKVAEMRSIFPNETIYLCYTSLAKHNGEYDKGCQELVDIASIPTLKRSAKTSKQVYHTTSSSRKRKRPSSGKSENPQTSSPGKRQDPITLSDSDEQAIAKQEPTPKRRKASSNGKRVAIISDELHGSQIDLTMPEVAEESEEGDTSSHPKWRSQKHGNHKKLSPTDKPANKPFRAVWVEIPSSPVAKSHIKERLNEQDSFPASPPAGTSIKGILKSSPGFRQRDSILSRALDSAAPFTVQPQTQLPDLPPDSHKKKSDPGLPPQTPAKKLQKAGPQFQVSSNEDVTESGWQALSPNSKSRMRPSDQIEKEAQPEARQAFFPPENHRIVGLLQRGIVRNPSASNSTSTKKKKHREHGF